MAVNPCHVRQRAQAFLEALSCMTAKEKDRVPAVQYGQQFNKLLQLAKEAAPAVDARLWPQSVGATGPIGLAPVANARYVEIETYVRQIISLVPEEPLRPSMG
jgi:hypothetical protein